MSDFIGRFEFLLDHNYAASSSGHYGENILELELAFDALTSLEENSDLADFMKTPCEGARSELDNIDDPLRLPGKSEWRSRPRIQIGKPKRPRRRARKPKCSDDIR